METFDEQEYEKIPEVINNQLRNLVSPVISQLAGMVLQDNLDKGRTISIPSLKFEFNKFGEISDTNPKLD